MVKQKERLKFLMMTKEKMSFINPIFKMYSVACGKESYGYFDIIYKNGKRPIVIKHFSE